MRYLEVHHLKQKGFKVAAIAWKLCISRNTVYRNLAKTPDNKKVEQNSTTELCPTSYCNFKP
ncbi:orotate phosphoribosyltransferase-like protein [Alkalihalobacillus hemicentroti]|uniref:Orotate phosphoribosyltransferase-like protein n=1 Tax=Guptibacillus hwajinpoensis TaxID=208199 RepID=A0ABU0JZA5_9BACL|nr:orotate phosphoribosyltransferase-like protein [Alkalihalobacillus hemicentroti]